MANILRADAQTNRDRILAVARTALAAEAGASVNSITKAAGVGAGTFYRHFPTREALVFEVYKQQIETLVTLGPALITELRPVEALRAWCLQVSEYALVKHSLAEALGGLAGQDFSSAHQPMLDTLRLLINAGKQTGELNASAEPEDIFVLLTCIWRLRTNDADQARSQRLLELVIRGLEV